MDWHISFEEDNAIENFNQLGRCADAIEKAMSGGQYSPEEIKEIANSMKLVCAAAVHREVNKSGDVIAAGTTQEIDKYLNPSEKEEVANMINTDYSKGL